MTDKIDFESALRNVINELKAPKNQYNSFGKYKYRNAEDILEAVKPLLNNNGLRLKTSDEVVQVGERYYVKSTVTIKGYGEEDSATGYAREAETKKGMDESQITGASSSYAKKYALNDMFDIDDTKDADSQDNSEKKVYPRTTSKPNSVKYATEDQKQSIAKLLTKEGISVIEIPQVLQEQYGVPQDTSLTFDRAKEIIADLKGEPF